MKEYFGPAGTRPWHPLRDPPMVMSDTTKNKGPEIVPIITLQPKHGGPFTDLFCLT